MVSGNFGFLTLNPISLLTSSFNANFPASTNCIIDVDEKVLDIEAILNIPSFVSGVLLAISFNPKE
jgi:hypothetical protein